MDAGQHAVCCRASDPEIVDSEPDMFQCDTCEFRLRVDGLDPDNVAAWRFYAKLTSHRWLHDMQAGPWWLQQIAGGLDEDERDEVLDRIDVIYDTLHPKQEKRRGA